jgi:hypothetical protein
LYTAVRASGAATSNPAADIVIPDDGQRLLTAHSPLGGITSFRSDGAPHRVQENWDQELFAAGWRPLSDWSGDDEIRRATFGRTTGDTVELLEAAVVQSADGTTTGIADWRRE